MRRCIQLGFLLLAVACRRETGKSAHPQPVSVAPAGFCHSADECEQGCGLGKSSACVEAGHLYEYGRGVQGNAPKAFQFYERACELNDAAGCYNMAVLLEAGRGVAQDLVRARELYGQVCAKGSNTACAKKETLSAMSDAGQRKSEN